jgi:ribA/ribD-fused uncharacterized protein
MTFIYKIKITQSEMTNVNEKYFENNNYVLFVSGYPSQWYPCEFIVNGIRFNCSEQYMMYRKALLFNDIETAQLILAENDPKKIKQLGRLVKNFDADAWNDIADDVVFEGNYAKFSQNPALYEKLMESRDKEYVECAPYDKIWGNGLNITDTLKTPKAEWLGTNRLGLAIMRVRQALEAFQDSC